jgi:hypothetical protein
MTDQPIARAINNWRWSWERDRRKCAIGTIGDEAWEEEYVSDEAWEEYVNSLTMSEVLWNLYTHDEPE